MTVSERRKSLFDVRMGGVGTWIFLLCATALFTRYAEASEPRVVCYYTNWSVYRPGTARFNPQNINPYLCTHLIYAFGGFTKDNTLKPFDKYQDIEKGGYAKFTGLKTYNNRLKTMLAIGGWNEGSTRFSPMVASRERRKEFVRNAIKFLRQNRFDGLDLDWEYPAFRDGGKPKDRDNYARLVRELREEFDKESEKTGKPRLLLTMAVPAGIEYVQKGFDVQTLNKYLDWMNLLSYDYHSAFEPAVNHHAPLYPLEEPNEYSVDNELNIDYTIQYYLENGADRDKLVLGIPTYGRSYTLFNPDATEIGSPADGPGEQGDATREKGYLAYYEICESLQAKPKKKKSVDNDEDSDAESDDEEEEDLTWTVMHPNPQAMGPVAFRGNQWVGYDDLDIVKKKAEYVADKGLGGIMFWSIDNDDFRGNCHGKPYPLIEAAKEAYINKLGITDNAITSEKQSSPSNRRRGRPKSSSSTSTSTPRSTPKRKTSSAELKSSTPSWSTPEPPTTPDPGSDFKCTDEGFFPHPRDCKKYFWCLDSGPSNLGIVAHQFTCPSGLYFNKGADSCDFARNVFCKKPSETTTSKPKTTSTSAPRTTTTTTRAPTVTTTRRPNKLTSKSSVYFRTTSSTTAASVLDEDEVYEDDLIDDADATDVDSEDPKVIKELVDLIKKAGGVEQLERFLKLSDSSASPAGTGTTTPLPISKKLYQKVLEQTRQGGKSSLLERYNTVSRDSKSGGQSGQNSRVGPQNAGLENVPEASSIRKERPQYTTINRSRPSSATTEETDEEDEQSAEEDANESPFKSRIQESSSARPLPQYVNIRRARPSTEPPSDDEDDTASRNALFERNEASFVSTVSELPPRPQTPEYVTIRRSRPTTAETTTAKYQTIQREKPVYEEPEEEGTLAPVSAALQYSTVQRTRTPPAATIADEFLTSPSPTTVLSVQISSLLNSPITDAPEPAVTEAALSEPEPTVLATPEPEFPTTVTDPPTTTTIKPSSTPTRRTILKRVRSTTTTTTASSSAAPQVSSERNYNIIRRRRPNEISSESDPDGTPRKIRSTTPDSRETPSEVRSDGETGLVSRGTRLRRVRPSTAADDSVASAAAPISRGRFRPAFSRDDVLSLTPIDDESPETVPLERIAPRPERKFRPRNRPVTPSDSSPDAEASAATVELRRPEFIPRGRNRFSVSTTTQAATSLLDVASTETIKQEKRLTFSRFTPRPFSRFSSNAPVPEEALVSDTVPNESESEITSATPGTPVRLPFGRTRSPIVNPRTIVPQARIVSPLLRRPLSSTPVPVDEPVSEDELEEKNDDIHLSESSIEEKEHDNVEVEEPQEKPRRRIVIKKIKPSVAPKVDEQQFEDVAPTSENDINASAVTPGDDSGRHRKLKIIRRRPTSIASSIFQEPVTEPLSVESSSLAPVPNRIRKIIRKKIIHAPESTSTERDDKSQDNDDKLSVELNYGDRARPVELSTKIELEVTKNVPLSESSSPSSITESETVIIQASEETPTSPISVVSTTNEDPIKDDDDISDGKIKKDEEASTVDETVQLTESTTKLSTVPSSTTSKSKFGRPTYRVPKRIFTSSTEAAATPSSRSYSRKYNAGTYTSPVTPDPEANVRVVTRRPLFTSKPSGRRPFLARTTKKIEEDYDEEEPEEEVVEEPESQLVLVPDNKLFTRGHSQKGEGDDLEESDNTEDDISEEEQQPKVNIPTSRRPFFRPKSVNSSTFRTSTTTTEVPKRQYLRAQNKTSIYNSSRTIFNNTKKRTQNVPFGYNASSNVVNENTSNDEDLKQSENEKQDAAIETTTNSDETEETTIDEDYLSVTSLSNFNASEKIDITSTNTEYEPATATEQMEVESTTDDYMDSTRENQEHLSSETSTVSQHIFSETQTEPSMATIESSQTSFTDSDNEVKTEAELTTITPTVPPVVKTHLDKLFSVSRVIEISSKLDKHKVNKKNESRLVETGKVMQEKKPTVDRIGEVSRFTLIKIVKDDIPIYLTKLGHAYPVDNPPNNPIRIDEGRNARTLMNFTDAGRENLVASESVNEAYRHINKLVSTIKDSAKTDKQLELLKEEHFEVYQNAEDRIDKSETLSPYPVQWQFIPAAYENDLTKEKHNKVAKSFEVVTPRTFKTDPSTIALEGLFKTENPLLITARKFPEGKTHGTGINQPFVVYAAQRPVEDPANFVKLQVLKTDNSARSVKTYVRGEELSGMSAVEKATVKYPISISILASEMEDKEMQTTTDSITEIGENYTPANEQTTMILTTSVPTTIDDLNMTVALETATEPETTTPKAIVSSEALVENAKKRPKLTFPRRSNFRNANITRTSASPLASLARTPKKSNSTTSLKSNKSTGFNPNKSRFSASRSQNVPVDIRGEKTKVVAVSQRQNSTTPSAPSGGDSSRKLYLKPIRSSLLRPSFVPRRPSTQATTQTTRRSFPRRTTPRATDLPHEASESSEATTHIPETSTNKYRIRGNSKFDKKRTTVKVNGDTSKTAQKSEGDESSRKPTEGLRAKKRPSVESETATAQAQTSGAVRRPTRTYVRRRYGAAANGTTIPISSSTEKTQVTEATRRPFRVVSRRRSTPAPTSPSTPAAEAKKSNSDLAVLESMETKKNHDDQPTEPKRPHLKKTVKIQRRPLTSTKSETSPPPSPSTTTEEPKKRESKKYSATFKQNQLDEVIRQKSAESTARSEDSTEPLEELSVDTAIAIATHQLLGAPLPSTPSYEDEEYPSSSKKHPSSSTKTYASTESYSGYPNSKDYSSRGVTGYTSTIVSSDLPGSTVYSKYDLSSRSPVYSTSTTTYSNNEDQGSTPGYSRESSYIPTSRFLSQTNKYVSIPIEDFGYSTDSYTSGLGQEPVYFTRDYLMESPVTRRYETDYQYLTTELPKTRNTKRPSTFRRISTTIAPSEDIVLPSATPQPRRVPQKVKIYDKLPKNDKKATYRPILNYDYYDEGDEKLLDMYPEKSKVLVHEKGNIECLDRGNFPHPSSCSKFISCARMESGALVGWEYVCPQGLSYDPVGGICNWSAGLGCHDS